MILAAVQDLELLAAGQDHRGLVLEQAQEMAEMAQGPW